MPLKRLGHQYTTCLTSSRGPGILGATGLSYALPVMVDCFNIFVNRYLSAFIFSYSLLPYLANEAVLTIYLYDRICLPVSRVHAAYIEGM
jgi:hypothetical protein